MSLRHWLHNRVSPGFANLAAVVGALGGRIVIEALPNPEDLVMADPPGHSLADKDDDSRPALTPVSPRAIKDPAHSRPGAAPNK